MAYVNFQRAYVRFKIVYYGPGLCGKTTNLEKLHDLAGGEVEMVSLETEGDRTIFFDYLPLNLGKLGGIETVYKLYTVPGQVRYNRTRQMVLRDVDGVVFVADSQRDALEPNRESLRNLRENLASDGVDLDELPMVIQYNKRDLDDISSIEVLEEQLNPRGLKWFAASAIEGKNVKETLIAVARQVYDAAAARYSMIPEALAQESEPPKSESLPPGEAEEPAERAREQAGTAPPPPPEDEQREALQPEPPAEEQPAPDEAAGEGQPAEEQPDLPPERSGLDSWQAVEDRAADGAEQRTTVAPGAREAAETVPPGMVAEVQASAALEGLEQRLMKQIHEMREVLQQLAMTQVEQDALDEFRRETVDLHAAMQEQLERSRHFVRALLETVGKVGEEIRGLRDEMRQEIKREVDSYLQSYLQEVEQGLADMPVAGDTMPPGPIGDAEDREKRDSKPIAAIRPTPAVPARGQE